VKILHVIAALYPERGGPAKVGPEMCRALGNKGVDVSIYTTNLNISGILDVPIDCAVVQDGVSVYYFPISGLRQYGFSLPLAKALRACIPTFDLVHIHSLYMFHTSASAHFCRKYKVPYIIRPHGTLDPYLRRKSRIKKGIYNLFLEKRNLDKASAIHYTSEEEMILAHRPMNIQSPGVVVPLGLNPEDYVKVPAPDSFRNRYPECRGKFLYLFLGRLDFKKGLDLLSRAFGEIARQRGDVHLVIAGPDEAGCIKQMRIWLAEEGILDRVSFPGMLSGKDKLAAFNDADVFVLSSYTENFGVALVEAMACGMPVVISDRVNIWREISDAEAGLVTKCNADDVFRGMYQLLKDPDLRIKLGRNARELVADRYNWDKNIDLMIDVYAKIIKRSHITVTGINKRV
jgi:glycosyltransferase involved in cell wall biosynthesis